MEDFKPVKILNYKGLPCPMPIVKMSQDIKKVEIGEVVEVQTSDPGSIADFPACTDWKVSI